MSRFGCPDKLRRLANRHGIRRSPVDFREIVVHLVFGVGAFDGVADQMLHAFCVAPMPQSDQLIEFHHRNDGILHCNLDRLFQISASFQMLFDAKMILYKVCNQLFAV